MSGATTVTNQGGEQSGQTVTQTGGVTRVQVGGEAEQLPSGSESVDKARPEGLPAEFNSWAEMAAAYEKIKPKEGAKPGEQQQTQEQSKPDADKETPAADPRFAPYTEEVTKTGTLSAESKAKAAAEFGVPLAVVEQYLAGAANSAASIASAAKPFHDEFGGAENYAKFNEWASDNLDTKEVAEFNKLLDTNPTAALVMARDFNAKFKAAGNVPPRDITRNATTEEPASETGFKNVSEMKAAMGDPRYENDPDYRRGVERRVHLMK